MGHFSHSCKLSGLPITHGTPIALIGMTPTNSLYEYERDKLKKYGSSYMCTNDSTQAKFNVVWFPILGEYNDYGGVENIKEDDNTKALEEHYGLPIQNIVDIVTCGRKRDGYSESLDVIKEEPDSRDENGNRRSPKYKERYNQLLSVSAMWVHGEYYKRITDEPTGEYFDKLDNGTPEILEALGFKEIGNDESEDRYKRQFEKDGLVVLSDGTWLHVKDSKYGIYSLPDFKKYCEERDVDIDISDVDGKGRADQIFDYLMPKYPSMKYANIDKYDVMDKIDELKKEHGDKVNEVPEYIEQIDLLAELISNFSMSKHSRIVNYTFLNRDDYNITNPMTPVYVDYAKEGKCRDSVVRFWRFNWYMYCTGNYYELVGTAPQDGEYKFVQKAINIASDIINETIQERKDNGWYDEEDE